MKTTTKFFLSSLMFAVFALFLIGSGDETSDDEKDNIKNDKGISITAVDLRAEAEKNEVNYIKKYKGKVLVISGKVEEFDTGLSEDEVIIKLSAGAYTSVRCKMDASQEDAIAAISKGDRVKIKGMSDGVLMGDPQVKGGLLVK